MTNKKKAWFINRDAFISTHDQFDKETHFN